jgi:GAF domain-containing protein
MTDKGDLRAAIAAGVLAAEVSGEALLRSVVDVARAVFAARACSVMLHDPAANELEWVAVSGEGEGELEGRRLPATTGLAGWVHASGEPIIVEDVQHDPRFARSVAESTGYVPQALMVAPLLGAGESSLGVLSVLDRTPRPGLALAELDLLGRFAAQAAEAAALRGAVAGVQRILDAEQPETEALVRTAHALLGSSGASGPAAQALLSALGDVLEAR